MFSIDLYRRERGASPSRRLPFTASAEARRCCFPRHRHFCSSSGTRITAATSTGRSRSPGHNRFSLAAAATASGGCCGAGEGHIAVHLNASTASSSGGGPGNRPAAFHLHTTAVPEDLNVYAGWRGTRSFQAVGRRLPRRGVLDFNWFLNHWLH